MSQLSKQEVRYIADGIIRKRYGWIQTIIMLLIVFFILISWEFAIVNPMYYALGMLGAYFIIFEPLRRRDTKRELSKLYEIHGHEDSGELRESDWDYNSEENIAINMLNVADKVEENLDDIMAT